MLIIILVISWYVCMGINSNVSENISMNLQYNNKHFQRGMWLVLVNTIKGFTASYTLWLAYHYVVEYVVPLF